MCLIPTKQSGSSNSDRKCVYVLMFYRNFQKINSFTLQSVLKVISNFREAKKSENQENNRIMFTCAFSKQNLN